MKYKLNKKFEITEGKDAIFEIEIREKDGQFFESRKLLSPELFFQAGEFVLQYQWFKGPSPIRRGPTTERWLLWLDFGAPKAVLCFMHMNPIDNPRVGAEIQKVVEREWMVHSGYVEPGTFLNPTKETPSGIEILDSGEMVMFEDAHTFKKFELFGKKIAGLWAAEREPGTDYWWVFRTEAIEERVG